MEAERKSLASFFGIDKFTQHEDISQTIAQQYVSDKQWWYVDKEVQFFQSDNIPMNIDKRNDIEYAYFNRDATKIIAMPAYAISKKSCFKCVWDRTDGKELGRIDYNTYCEKQKQRDEECIWTYIPYIPFFSVGNELDQEKEVRVQQFCEKYPHATIAAFKTVRIAYNLPFNSSLVYVWHKGKEEEKLTLLHENKINFVSLNQDSGEIITASDDCSMRLWHSKTGQELLRVVYDTCVASASFNEMRTEIVVATDDGNIQILVKYHTDNLQQLLLNKLLHIWLVLKKPSKEINSVTKLLDNVAQLLRIRWQDLYKAWGSFPEHVQQAMWLSMSQKIQRYGK